MGPGILQLSFGSNVVALATNTSAFTGNWLYQSYTAQATDTVTRLVFDGAPAGAALDMVTVRWLEEPPSLLVPVASRSAFEGATVTFLGKVSAGLQPFINGLP